MPRSSRWHPASGGDTIVSEQGAREESRGAIRILIVDDQAIVRKGIRALLSSVDDFEVVGEASGGSDAVCQAKALKPDVVVMDLAMPGMGGVEAIREIVSLESGTQVLVLTGFTSDGLVVPAIRAGALGYLLKDAEPVDLILAIEHVSRGEPWLEPSVAMRLLNELREPAQKVSPTDILTVREGEVLRLVARGLSNREIATELDTTEATVKSHVSNILSKLRVANRVQATLFVLQGGILPLQDILPDET
jgi:two-component system, NarL family, response regulator LiaR